MVTPICKRDREDPESAMLHQPEASQRAIEAREWPYGVDERLKTEREDASAGGRLPSPHAEAIDRAAYDRFMRSLG